MPFSDPANTHRVLEIIRDYYTKNNISPTYREIAHALGWSTDRVFSETRKLVAAGQVRVSRRAFRGIEIVGAAFPPVAEKTGEPRRTGRCERCHILVPGGLNLCHDCEFGLPLIQTADAMGAERFYQMQRPVPVGMGYEKETKRRTRRTYKREGAQ